MKKYAYAVILLMLLTNRLYSTHSIKTERECLENLLNEFIQLHSDDSVKKECQVKIQNNLHVASYELATKNISLTPNLVDLFLTSDTNLENFEFVLLHELGHAHDQWLRWRIIGSMVLPSLITQKILYTLNNKALLESPEQTRIDFAKSFLKRMGSNALTVMTTFLITTPPSLHFIYKPAEWKADSFAIQHKKTNTLVNFVLLEESFTFLTSLQQSKDISSGEFLEATFNKSYIEKNYLERKESLALPNKKIEQIFKKMKKQLPFIKFTTKIMPYIHPSHPSGLNRTKNIAESLKTRTKKYQDSPPSLYDFLCNHLLKERSFTFPESQKTYILTSFNERMEDNFDYTTTLFQGFSRQEIINSYTDNFNLQNFSYEQLAQQENNHSSILKATSKENPAQEFFLKIQEFRDPTDKEVITFVTSAPISSLGLFLLQNIPTV